MQIKSIAMMVIAGCVIGLSTGCIKQEEYDGMVKKLTDEKTAAVAEIQDKLTKAESDLTSEKGRTRTLDNDLRESATLNDELKQDNKDLKNSLADEKGKASALESQITSAKAAVQTAKDQAAQAETERATMEAQAQEAKRRFDALIENLILLNKIKPEDVGFDGTVVSGGEYSISEPSETGTATGTATEAAESQEPSSASDILNMMENM